MLSIDKNNRMTIEIENGLEDKWRGNTWYYAYLDKHTLTETRIAFVEDKRPQNPKSVPEILNDKFVLGHFRTDQRGRFTPNVFMKSLPGKVNYEEWGLMRTADGSPYLVKFTDFAEVLRGIVRDGSIRISDLIALIDS